MIQRIDHCLSNNFCCDYCKDTGCCDNAPALATA
jgi:hypothetical protein